MTLSLPDGVVALTPAHRRVDQPGSGRVTYRDQLGRLTLVFRSWPLVEVDESDEVIGWDDVLARDLDDVTPMPVCVVVVPPEQEERALRIFCDRRPDLIVKPLLTRIEGVSVRAMAS